MSSGTKRNYDDHHARDNRDRREKPKDWRDAFLDEDEPRRSGGSRDSNRDRQYDDRRSGSSRDVDRGSNYRDRDRDRYSGQSRDNHPHRERERNDRRHGDRDGRRDERRYPEREEGEIEPSPPQPPTRLPTQPGDVRLSPRRERAEPQQRGGFQSISIPSGPKSRVPQTRPPPSAMAGKQPSPETQPEPVVVEEDRDPEQILEERRRKREEIMAKFKSNGARPAATPASSDTPVGTGADSVVSGGAKTAERSGLATGTTTGATPLLKHLGTKSSVFLTPNAPTPVGGELSMPATPLGKDLDLSKDGATEGEVAPSSQEGISAADYDPTLDKKDDEDKRAHDAEAAGVEPVKPEPKVVEEEWEEVEIEEEEEDEDVDMFAAFGDEEQPKKKRKVIVRRKKGANGEQEVIRPKKASVLDVVDNVDDTDGYYRITPGEILDDGRYQITITLGKGMFSAVVKAKVLKAVGQERRQDVVGKEVAIKVIRSQESMYVAGRKEAQILKKLNEADPEDKKHIVRMEHQFEHRGHLCIVTESMSMNLRDVIKRFGKDVGLNMRAVRAYAHQMFLALSLMRKCSVVHADIKPDNILVSDNKAVLKVCDLGSASDVSDGEITPYLVSRFYRAPEIILGLPYDTSIDVWSVGCTLYELFTGKILFPGRSNNHMLLLMMEVKGKLAHRMIKKASFGEMYFDEAMNFISIEKEKITGQDVAKTIALSKATKDLRSKLLPPSSVQLKMKDDEVKQLHNFIDLLDKCLQLDPAKRLTPRDALMHPWLAGH